jgi:hypothetical protein
MEAVSFKLRRPNDQLCEAVSRGEVPSLEDIVSGQELESIASYLGRSDEVFLALAIQFASDHVFDDDDALERLVGQERFAWLPAFLVRELGRRLSDVDWALVRRRLDQVLRDAAPHCLAPLRDPVMWRPFVRHQRSEHVADLLREHGWHVREMPLYEALRAAAVGRDASLVHLPPEVRKPAEDVLAILLALDAEEQALEAQSEPPPPLKSSPRVARTRRAAGKKPRRSP